MGKTAERTIRVPVLLGPTAVGKTAIAVEVARELDVDIISCDSRQVYRGMDIGTAKPSADEQASVRHWLVDVVDPDESYSAFAFAEEAVRILRELALSGRRAMIVGGTGLYYQCLSEGLGPQTPADEAYRRKLRERVESCGRNGIFKELMAVDPATAVRLHPNDIQRIIRALEVHHTTGVPLSELQKRTRPTGECEFAVVVASRLREELYARIDARVVDMFRCGLQDEFRELRRRGYGDTSPGMQCLGYRELMAVEGGQLGQSDVVASVQQNTRRYAKKQMTWFRNKVSGTALSMTDDPVGRLCGIYGTFLEAESS
jgi:tRNA dimethylallyltransferase